MIVVLWKAAAIAGTLVLLVAGFIWWLEGYMGRPLQTTITPPWELTAAEIDRLVDMPEHLVLYGSDDDFNAWLRGGLPGMPRPLGLGQFTRLF